MKLYRVLLGVLVICLVLPLVGCNQILEQAVGAIASRVPQVTAAATSSSQEEPTASGKGSSATIGKVKATVAPAEEATATKAPTRTPKPKATAKPTPEPASVASDYLPAGAQILLDDFSDPDSGFAEDQNDEYAMAYVDGTYQVDIYAAEMIAWGSANLDVGDFVAEVTAEKIAGPDDGDYGFIYRLQDANNFYVFKVADNGSYSVSALVDNEWQEILPWTDSDVINLGGINIIAIVAEGNAFSFYINGTMVDSVVDDTFTSGDLALFGSTYNEGNLQIQYTDLKVWEVDANWSGATETGTAITPGEVIYSEDFSDNSTGWDEWQTENSLAGYVDGQYVIEVYKDTSIVWGNAYQAFDDFIITVEALKTSGSDDNGVGLVLRYQDVDNFYVFAVSTDGQYTFGYYLDNEWTAVVEWTPSDAINTGEAVNTLGVAVKGDTFILSINDTTVNEFQDSTLSSGDIGLLGAANSEGNISFAFDNLTVWSVE